MGGYSFFDYCVLIVAGLIVGYIVIRVLSYGFFRSYFEAKKKEDKNHGSSK